MNKKTVIIPSATEVAEFAYDLHAGLSLLQVPDFDDLQTIGMASTLAVHIKGLGEIEYEVLRRVSDHLMSIPSVALEKVLRVLSDIGFVRLVEDGRKILSVIPYIPIFEDVYRGIGDYASAECDFNEHEQITLALLAQLQSAPRNRDALFNELGAERPAFDRCTTLAEKSGIVSAHKARGRDILISPFYFADNLDALADAAVAAGANAIQSTLKKVKENQGWPLSLVATTGEIGGLKLTPTENDLVQKLADEGVIRPPTIKFGTKTESFLFTPRPGSARLNAANREIYERAMALISAVRKGQLLAIQYPIKMPLRILMSLRDKGYLRANSEAREQYYNLVVLRVAQLKPVGGSQWQLHLNRTQENLAALDLAISLLRSGTLADMEVNQSARIALTKGEEYIQSMISAKELKARQRQVSDEQASHEFEQLILKLE
ncbi:hypothetical protein ACQR1N_20335 [Bradyrhizobium sp. HKCCYLRH1073]|uniref:hypothetical protein n=1 Tax=unclassified Bradyrhizobium TaxID=2631580 RepID=UPI003EBD8B36